jgi:outer membrane receptor protein involved in Fe transport
MSLRLSLLAAAGTLSLGVLLDGSAGWAQDASSSSSTPTSQVVVTAQRLNQARDAIQPQIGASTYTLSGTAIQALPGGDNADFNQLILQAPGAVQDSYGQLHIRGDHNGLQFRLNGVILPEGLSVFSQALSPRLAGSVQLVTGALPAEYGLRTAGIIDIKTKSGAQSGGSVSIYGGSHGDVEPSVEYGGGDGTTNFFVSGSYKQNDLGIEAPDTRTDPLHDHTEQFQGFAYLDRIIDPSSRVSLILGASDQKFQIPDVSGELNGGLGLNVNGQTTYPSSQLNEQQSENTQYAVLSYLHSTDKLTSQTSLFGRYSTLNFSPDAVGDLLYDGISQTAAKSDVSAGVQADAAYTANDHHTVRFGALLQIDRATSDTTSQVMLLNNNPADPAYGQQIGNRPYGIVDNTASTAQTYSVYVQDEWKALDNVTVNYGLRFDQFDGYRDENQLSPRINVVWLPLPATTVHVGYARYFSPPPFELVGSESVAKFTAPTGNPLVTSTAAPSITTDTTPYSERSNYYDVGAEQKFGSHLTVGLDTYYKAAIQLIDEGQFGAPVILTPFNYAEGQQWGIELTMSYNNGPFSAYANASHAVAQGKDWDTSQFNFTQAQLDYLAKNYILLDHDEAYALSAGASYLWRRTRFGADLLFGTGLRTDAPLATPITYPDGSVLSSIPNGGSVPAYVQVNLALSHIFDLGKAGTLEARLDVINLFDEVYEIRDGTGVGVFAPQYGPRRGVFGGLTKSF